LQDTVDKISLEQIKTNKKVDQLEEKISLGQIKTDKKVDNLEEKIEKLGSKVITVEDLNEVNNNISDAIDQLKDDMKTSLEKFSEYGCSEPETDVPNIANGNKDGTNLTEDHTDALNHVKEMEEKAILVVGGFPSDSLRSVEAITTDGTPLCTLPDLPDKRCSHTIENHITCGGSYTQSSCLHYVAGKWTKYGCDLKFKRYAHVSWRREDGEVMLIGGANSKKTSEVVSSSGHQNGFNVQHEVYTSCAIKLDDHLIITGGYPFVTTVSKYGKNGFMMDLASMNTGRRDHACGHYYSVTNELMYLVTGGYNGNCNNNCNTISTEVMSASGTNWYYVGNLPRPTRGLKGMSINNQIFVTGGYMGEYLKTILRFNPASNEWEKSGEMKFARRYHAVAVLPLKEVKPYCL